MRRSNIDFTDNVLTEIINRLTITLTAAENNLLLRFYLKRTRFVASVARVIVRNSK